MMHAFTANYASFKYTMLFCTDQVMIVHFDKPTSLLHQSPFADCNMPEECSV